MKSFKNRDLSGINFSGQNLYGATFLECNLEKAEFSGAALSSIKFVSCNLNGANFELATLHKGELACCSFKSASFYGINAMGLYVDGGSGGGAWFNGANLYESRFHDVDLTDTNFVRTNLSLCEFVRVDLRGARLDGANLSETELREVKLDPKVEARLMVCPPEGAFIGWKKCRHNILVKLLIPAGAKRSSSTSRKCRAEYVRVLEVLGDDVAYSDADRTVIYKAGGVVRCDHWEPNRWKECAGGIHFFMTKEEALAREFPPARTI